jgi:hypothetical protein
MRAVLLCLWTLNALAADVRHAVWGMSPEQVQAEEGMPPLETSVVAGELRLRFPAADLAPGATVVYAFENRRLVRATYVFANQHADPNDFVADFHAVTAQLVARFGRASAERAVWLDDSLQNERIAYLEQDRALPSDILPSDPNAGLAIALGHLQLVSQWEQPRSLIRHTMTGSNRAIRHQVEFTPR